MKTIKYFSCENREQLENIISFDGNYYEDNDLIIDVIGVVDLNKPVELQEDEEDTREPTWSDYLFNVFFKNESKTQIFDDLKIEQPQTPIRTFL